MKIATKNNIGPRLNTVKDESLLNWDNLVQYKKFKKKKKKKKLYQLIDSIALGYCTESQST